MGTPWLLDEFLHLPALGAFTENQYKVFQNRSEEQNDQDWLMGVMPVAKSHMSDLFDILVIHTVLIPCESEVSQSMSSTLSANSSLTCQRCKFRWSNLSMS